MGFKFNPFTGTFDEVGAGSTTTPGGSDTEIQYNDSGSFAGSADLTWDDTGKVLGVGGDIDLDDGGTYTTTLQTITPTAARTISFPNATGTVGLVGGSSGNLVVNQSGAYAGVANSSVDNATGNITLGSRFISSLNGAASAPPGAFTGTWFTGGTATTTKPQVLVEPTGATSTAWSTSGTGLGVNAASAFAGNLLDLQVNGTSQFRVSSAGALNAASAIVDNGVSGRGLAVSAYTAGGTGSAGARLNAQLSSTNATLSLATQGTDRLSFNQSTITVSDAHDIALGGTTGTKIGTATTQKLGFFGVTPVVQQTELTDELTTITHTAPGTPDYAIQNLVAATGYGFVTEDEGNTVLSVIANLQARVNELETKLVALGFLADAD